VIELVATTSALAAGRSTMTARRIVAAPTAPIVESIAFAFIGAIWGEFGRGLMPYGYTSS
jgi:hypothetical protein